MPSERNGNVTVLSGKGSKYRDVPLNLDAHRAIEQYRAVRSQGADAHLKYARRAGLEGVSPHSLRHTFGKSALDAGVDLVTVAALMGYDSVETTAIYTHPPAIDLERAVEKRASD